MVISDIITKYYDELAKMCTDNVAIAQGRTEMDILQDVCLTALKKYKDNDIDEEEGFQYLKKSLLLEKKFQYHRKDKVIIYTDNLESFGF